MEQDRRYYAHGKLLLSGEYWVLHGARALGLPLNVGQSLEVRYRRSYNPKVNWIAKDHRGEIWFQGQFDLWHFRPLSKDNMQIAETLQALLIEARILNKHFLREEVDVEVETKLSFPRDWGLGSSSTLVVALAQWARVSPFSLQEKVFGGSGADVAISQAPGPVIFERQGKTVSWRPIEFRPIFSEKLYFLYLGKKQSTREAIARFVPDEGEVPYSVIRISGLTEEMLRCQDLGRFIELLSQHDEIVGKTLGRQRLMESEFSDFPGYVKGLGAWGGDFALVASHESPQAIREYFQNKGMSTLIAYNEMVFSPTDNLNHGQVYS